MGTQSWDLGNAGTYPRCTRASCITPGASCHVSCPAMELTWPSRSKPLMGDGVVPRKHTTILRDKKESVSLVWAISRRNVVIGKHLPVWFFEAHDGGTADASVFGSIPRALISSRISVSSSTCVPAFRHSKPPCRVFRCQKIRHQITHAVPGTQPKHRFLRRE